MTNELMIGTIDPGMEIQCEDCHKTSPAAKRWVLCYQYTMGPPEAVFDMCKECLEKRLETKINGNF